MLVQKSNLLQRVRVVMIALVAVIGFGTMAMKPAERLAAHTYGVALTSGGQNWEIVADVTGQTEGVDYFCDTAPQSACLVFSDSPLDSEEPIPAGTLPSKPGKFTR